MYTNQIYIRPVMQYEVVDSVLGVLGCFDDPEDANECLQEHIESLADTYQQEFGDTAKDHERDHSSRAAKARKSARH